MPKMNEEDVKKLTGEELFDRMKSHEERIEQSNRLLGLYTMEIHRRTGIIADEYREEKGLL